MGLGELVVGGLTALAAVITALYGILTWKHQRESEALKEQKRLSTMYVKPFLRAAEALQSRLYNILELDGLATLRERQPNGIHAEDTIYLIGAYFGWERSLDRYGPYASDGHVVRLTERIRHLFATDDIGVGAFCFVRPEQLSLGQSVVRRVPAEEGPGFDTVALHEFRSALQESPYSDNPSIVRSVSALRQARSAPELEGRERLILVQRTLVELLLYLETKEGYTLFDGVRKQAAPYRVATPSVAQLTTT